MNESLNHSPMQNNDKAVDAKALNADTSTMLPFAQLGLRLMGVMLVVDGVAAIVGGVIQGLLQARAYANAGYSAHLDSHSTGWFAFGLVQLMGGLYLITKGNWVLHNVFAPSRGRQSNMGEDAIGTDTSATD